MKFLISSTVTRLDEEVGVVSYGVPANVSPRFGY